MGQCIMFSVCNHTLSNIVNILCRPSASYLVLVCDFQTVFNKLKYFSVFAFSLPHTHHLCVFLCLCEIIVFCRMIYQSVTSRKI